MSVCCALSGRQANADSALLSDFRVEITVNLIKNAMTKHIANGNTLFLIDGFPRNLDNRTGFDAF